MPGQTGTIEDVIRQIRAGLAAILVAGKSDAVASASATAVARSVSASPDPESIEQRLAAIEAKNKAAQDTATLQASLNRCIHDYNTLLQQTRSNYIDFKRLDDLIAIEAYDIAKNDEEDDGDDFDSQDGDAIGSGLILKAGVGRTEMSDDEEDEEDDVEVFGLEVAKLTFRQALQGTTNRLTVTVVPDLNSQEVGGLQVGSYFLEPDGLYQYSDDTTALPFKRLFTVAELKADSELAGLLVAELKQLRPLSEAKALTPTLIENVNILTLLSRGLQDPTVLMQQKTPKFLNFNSFCLTHEGLYFFYQGGSHEEEGSYNLLFDTKELDKYGFLQAARQNLAATGSPVDIDTITDTVISVSMQVEPPFVEDADPGALYLTGAGLLKLNTEKTGYDTLLSAELLRNNALLVTELDQLAALAKLFPVPTVLNRGNNNELVDAQTILAQLLQNESSVQVVMLSTLPAAGEAEPNTFYLTADGLFQLNAVGLNFNQIISAATLIGNHLLTEQLTQLRGDAAKQPRLWAMRAVPTDIDAFKATLPEKTALTAQNHIVTPQGLYQYNETELKFEAKKDPAALHDLDFTGQQLYAAADMEAATDTGYYLTPQGLFYATGNANTINGITQLTYQAQQLLTYAATIPKDNFASKLSDGDNKYYLTPQGVYRASKVGEKVELESLLSFNEGIGFELAAYCNKSATVCISSTASIALRAALEKAIYSCNRANVSLVSPIERTLNDFLTGSARSEMLVVCQDNLLPVIDSAQPLLSPRFVINATGLFQLNAQDRAYEETPILTSAELTGMGIKKPSELFTACQSAYEESLAKTAQDPIQSYQSYPVGLAQLTAEKRQQLAQAIDEKNKDKGFKYTANLAEDYADAVALNPALLGLAPVVVQTPVTLDADNKRQLCQVLADNEATALTIGDHRLNQADIVLRPRTVLTKYPEVQQSLHAQAAALSDRLQPIVAKLLEVTQFDARALATELSLTYVQTELSPEQIVLVKLRGFKLNLEGATDPDADASFTDVHAWHQQCLALEQDLQASILADLHQLQDAIIFLRALGGENVSNLKPQLSDSPLEMNQLDLLANLTQELDGLLANVKDFNPEQQTKLNRYLHRSTDVKLNQLNALLMPLTNLATAVATLGEATAPPQSIDPRVLIQILFDGAAVQSGLPETLADATAGTFYATSDGLFTLNADKDDYDRVATAAQLTPWLHLSQALAAAGVDALTVSDEKPSLMAEGQTFLYLSRDDGYSDPVLEKSTGVIHGLVSGAEQDSARMLTQLAPNDDLYLAASVESMGLVDEQSPRWLMTPAGLFKRAGLEYQEEEEWLTTYSYSDVPVLTAQQLTDLDFATLLTEAEQEGFVERSIQKEVPISQLYALQKELNKLFAWHQCRLVNERQYSLAKAEETVTTLEGKVDATAAPLNLAALRAMTLLCDRAVDLRVQDTTETSKLVAASATQQALFLQVAPFLVHGNQSRFASKDHRISQLARLVEEHIKAISEDGGYTQSTIAAEIAALTQLKSISDTCDQVLAKIKTTDAFLVRDVSGDIDVLFAAAIEGEPKQVKLPDNFAETCKDVIAKAQQELHVTQKRQLGQLDLRLNGYTTVKVIKQAGVVPALADREAGTLYVQAGELKANNPKVNLFELGDDSIEQLGNYQAYKVYTSAKEKPDVLHEDQSKALANALSDATQDEGVIEDIVEVNSIAVACGVEPLAHAVANSRSKLLSQELERLQQSLARLTLNSPDFTQRFTQLQGEIERLDNAAALCQASGYSPEAFSASLDTYPEALRDTYQQDVKAIEAATKISLGEKRYSLIRPTAGLQHSLDKGPINAKTVPLLMQRIEGYRAAVAKAEAVQNDGRLPVDGGSLTELRYRLEILNVLDSRWELNDNQLNAYISDLEDQLDGSNNGNIDSEKLQRIDSTILQYLAGTYLGIYAQLEKVAGIDADKLSSWPKNLNELDVFASVELLEQLYYQLLRAKSQQLSEAANPNNGGSSTDVTLPNSVTGLLAKYLSIKESKLPRLPLREMPGCAELIQQADTLMASVSSASLVMPLAEGYDKEFPAYVEQYWRLAAYGEKNKDYDEKLTELHTALEGMRDATDQMAFEGYQLTFQEVAKTFSKWQVLDKADVQWFQDDADIEATNFDTKFNAQYPRVVDKEPIKNAISAHLCNHITVGTQNKKVVAMLAASNRLMAVMDDGELHGFYQTEQSTELVTLIDSIKSDGFESRHLTAEETGGSLTVTATSKQEVMVESVTKTAIMTSAVTMTTGAFATTTTIPTTDLKLTADAAAKLAARETARTIYDGLWAQNLASDAPKSIAQFREFIGKQNYRVDPATLASLEANKDNGEYAQAAFIHATTLNTELEKLGFGVPCPAPVFDRTATVVTTPIVPIVNVVHIDAYQWPEAKATVGSRRVIQTQEFDHGEGYQDHHVANIGQLPPLRSRANSMSSTNSGFDADSLSGDDLLGVIGDNRRYDDL